MDNERQAKPRIENAIAIMKVSGGSPTPSVASAISKVFTQKEADRLELQAVGASAVNQAMKAIAVARGMLAPQGIDLACIPAFRDLVIDDVKKTGISIFVWSVK